MLFNSMNSTISSTLNALFLGVIQFLPKLFGALIVFALGWIIAGWTKAVLLRLFKAINVSRLTSSKSIQQFLNQAQITHTLESILGESVRWLIIFIFAVTSINILGLYAVTQVLLSILAYLPNILAAIIILVIGVLIAGVIEKVVKGSLSGIDLKMARSMGKFASYSVVTIAILAVLSQLGIAQNFINILFIGLVAMFALGFGLSIGLGSKDIVKTILEDWYKNAKKE